MKQLKTILPYFRPYRRPMFWGLVLVILANGFALANPYLLKLPIDALTADAGIDAEMVRLIGGPAQRRVRPEETSRSLAG